MARKATGEGLKTRGSGAHALRLVQGSDGVAAALAGAVAGTAAADIPPLGEHEIPEKPDRIANTPELSELWDAVVPMMARNGLLHEPDVILLEQMLRHLAAFRDASDELMLMGPTIPGKDFTTVKNPADVVMRGQSLQLLGILKEFGLTFVSRARRPGKDNGPAADGDNPFSQTGS